MFIGTVDKHFFYCKLLVHALLSFLLTTVSAYASRSSLDVIFLVENAP